DAVRHTDTGPRADVAGIARVDEVEAVVADDDARLLARAVSEAATHPLRRDGIAVPGPFDAVGARRQADGTLRAHQRRDRGVEHRVAILGRDDGREVECTGIPAPRGATPEDRSVRPGPR